MHIIYLKSTNFFPPNLFTLVCTMLPDKAVALHTRYLSPAGGTGELHVSPVNKGVNNFVFLSPDLICVSGLLH